LPESYHHVVVAARTSLHRGEAPFWKIAARARLEND
jgi:hypothetical protein